MPSYRIDSGKVAVLDLGGFNELRFCRHGPMLYNKNDLYVGKSLQKYGEFSHAEWELFERLVSPSMTVIEVGANIGAHSIPLAKRLTHGKLYAYEPQRLCFQLLCANVALNQLTNVRTFHAAVAAPHSKKWTMMAVVDPTTPFNYGGLPVGPDVAMGSPKETVNVVTLDDEPIIDCDFLKIDVEGMESEVLLGAKWLIEKHKPIIYCENDRREHSAKLCTLLHGMGYDLYWHLPPLFNPLNHANQRDNLFPSIVSINLLCLPNGVEPPMPMPQFHAHDELWGTVLNA